MRKGRRTAPEAAVGSLGPATTALTWPAGKSAVRRWIHLDDRPVRLEVPKWVYVTGVGSSIVTGGIASILYLPGPIAATLLGASIAAWLLWLRYSDGGAVSRRILPLYITTVVATLLLGLETWGLGLVDKLAAWDSTGTTGLVYSEAIDLSVFTMLGTSLFLVGAIAVFFHHPLGTYLVWFLFASAMARALLPFSVAAVTGWGYVPGMALGAVVGALGGVGLSQTTGLRIQGDREISHA